MRISIPYGSGSIACDIPDKRVRGVLIPPEQGIGFSDNERDIVSRALQDPVGSPRLRELARNREKIVILSSDHTRPVPSHVIMPVLLEEIRSGNPDADITILVATGGHRETRMEELVEKYGITIASQEKIIVHDSHNKEWMRDTGTLPSGGRLLLNKVALDADLLVAEGFIEPHFFAGFSGGRKSVLPGVASYETVLANHCSEFIAHPCSRTGIMEGNPIHEDMLYAARKAGLAFICNVVIDESKRIIAAFAGDMEKAHRQGCCFVREHCSVRALPADIVISGNGGYPMDQNLYQAVKGMTAAEASVKDGGVIIMATECRDGHGGEAFAATFDKMSSPKEVLKNILLRGRSETCADQWQIQIFLRVLLKATVIMVTSASREMVESLHMKKASCLEDALVMADHILGKEDTEITIIPDGVGVIVE